jgi:glutathione S-transferase
MMVMFSNTPLHCENYDLLEKPEGGWDLSCWLDNKILLKEKNPLINLPYVVDGDNVISQSNACFTYLGRKLNMMGASPEEMSECEQLLCECMDLRNKVTGFAYGGDGSTSAKESFFHGISSKNGQLEKLEQWLVKKSRHPCFFVGDRASAPDFHIWEMLDQLQVMAVVGLQSLFPRLSEFHSLFGSLSENSRYLSSALAALPLNNKMAVCGSKPSGAVYQAGHGEECAWHGTSGLY